MTAPPPPEAAQGEPSPVPLAGVSSRPVAALCVVFALSGASALIFETLWFRQAGLLVGNTVWASSLVMASFMGGLACGNAAAARWGSRVRRRLLAYALLEVVTASSGLALVPLLPALGPWLAPLFRALADRPPLLNALRSLLAFFLLLVPAACMGATLPVLVQWLTARQEGFGRALGRLYGWNTLGAVAGALAGGGLLLDHLGVRRTALAAALLNVAAAAVAIALSRAERHPDAVTPRSTGESGRASLRLLSASSLSGCILLALEVVWFRFLLLFVHGNSLAFGIMLSVVLAGIAIGSLGASAWLKAAPEAWRHLGALAFAAGAAVVVSYSHFAEALRPYGNESLVQPERILVVSIELMLPVSALSGALFTLMGQALRPPESGAARTAGVLTMANTIGAMAGALVAGFLLLPRLGMEVSLFVLACAYSAVALLVSTAGGSRWPSWSGQRRVSFAASALFFLAAVSLFPFGLMRNHFQKLVLAHWATPGTRLVAVREGLAETILYLRTDLLDEPVSYRLLTNAFSMSAAGVPSAGYMEVFVHLPLALNPDARRALLISYGVGSTAQALTSSRGLERIDVVDTSRDILELGRIVFAGGGPYPLDDPRVRVHVEDGRFFLATTARTYDLITGEPPPPKNAGIANLYSRDYFRLMRSRLATGGIATYWLPVFQLAPSDAKAIVRGFCDAFDDCSVWMGFGPEWVLMGTNGLGPVSADGFARQWHDPHVAPRLAALGLERPAHLGALFIADARSLDEFARGSGPLDDDHPGRLSQRFVGHVDPFYLAWADPDECLKRFQESDFVRRVWPEPLRTDTVRAFHEMDAVKQYTWDSFGLPVNYISQLYSVLTRTRLRAPVLWMMRSSVTEVAAARRARERGLEAPELDEVLGVGAMADRDYILAERLFHAAEPYASDPERLRQWRTLALCLADPGGDAGRVMTGRTRDPRTAAAWAQVDAACQRPASRADSH